MADRKIQGTALAYKTKAGNLRMVITEALASTPEVRAACVEDALRRLKAGTLTSDTAGEPVGPGLQVFHATPAAYPVRGKKVDKVAALSALLGIPAEQAKGLVALMVK